MTTSRELSQRWSIPGRGPAGARAAAGTVFFGFEEQLGAQCDGMGVNKADGYRRL